VLPSLQSKLAVYKERLANGIRAKPLIPALRQTRVRA
jgi:hypothetical protein